MRLRRCVPCVLLAVLCMAAGLFDTAAPQGLPRERGIGKKAGDDGAPRLRAYPVDLTADDFEQRISSIPDGTIVMLELYASWCPHCRHFAPTYDKIGAFFNGDPHLPGPPVWVARIDCAQAENRKICESYKLPGYPSVIIGFAHEVAARTASFTDGMHRTVDTLISDVALKTQAAYKFSEEVILAPAESGEQEVGVKEEPPVVVAAAPLQTAVDLQDVESATLQSFNYIISSQTMLSQPGARDALEAWVKLLAVTHPVSMCQKGTALLLAKFEQIWPADSDLPASNLRKFRVCGKDSKVQPWRGCKGSRPDTRGYTCGVWSLLHATTVNLPDDAGQFWVEAVKGFISNFFQCTVCAKHFTARISKDDAKLVSNRHDAVIWLWRVHNEVNGRLAKEEEVGGSDDKAFPKALWPPAELCSACRDPAVDNGIESVPGISVSWRDNEVHNFVMQYFGGREASETLKQRLVQVIPGRRSTAEQPSDGAKPWMHHEQQPSIASRPREHVRLPPTTKQQTGTASRAVSYPLRVGVGVLGIFGIVVVGVRIDSFMKGAERTRFGGKAGTNQRNQ